MKARILAGASALALIASAGLAHANTVTGTVYETTDAIARAATPANVPLAGPAVVTFSTNDPLNLDSRVGGYTIGGFLGSSGPFSVFIGAGHLGDNLDNTLWDFQGTVSVTHNQTFTVGHDDGLTLVINGLTVVNAAGPTSPTTTTVTYTGLTGNLPFELVYGECCGPPAVLNISLPLIGGGVQGSTPLPAALPLFAAGLGLFGAAGWRRRRKAASLAVC